MKRTMNMPRRVKVLLVSLLAIGVIGVASVGMLAFSPSIGANGAEVLRKIIGDQNVAVLETALFQAQDAVRQTEYHLGWIKPNNPFSASAKIPRDPSISKNSTSKGVGSGGGPLALVQKSAPLDSNSGIPPTDIMKPGSLQMNKSDPKPAAEAQSSSAASSNVWIPAPVTALGDQEGEGQWLPYLQNASGKVVAYRTFVMPDPQRPYALTGVVAFDLSSTRLHYQLGYEEPYASKYVPRQGGRIPAADSAAGVLIAAFNGGFKYEHGHFGSMSNGVTSAPPKDGLSVVAIYKDGSVKIGEWGKDITESPGMVAFRQNGPLVIQNGQPTAQVDNENLWGRTIASGVVTWRSGLAISADGKTLYYFAGPSLSIHTLANAMMAVHPVAAMQLDINNYWVHFISIQWQNNQASIESLFPSVMRDNKDRFLHIYSRDFFYVTVK